MAKGTQECSVNLGALDAIYCQGALVRFASFLNEAWPAPDLDPLAIKASVSLREVVQEALQSTQAMQMRKVAHQTFPHMQVRPMFF